MVCFSLLVWPPMIGSSILEQSLLWRVLPDSSRSSNRRRGEREDHSESCCSQEPCKENTFQSHCSRDMSSLAQCHPKHNHNKQTRQYTLWYLVKHLSTYHPFYVLVGKIWPPSKYTAVCMRAEVILIIIDFILRIINFVLVWINSGVTVD